MRNSLGYFLTLAIWATLCWPVGAQPSVQTISERGNELILEFEPGGFSISTVSVAGTPRTAIDWPGGIHPARAGAPDLPHRSVSILLPSDHDARIADATCTVTRRTAPPIRPAPDPSRWSGVRANSKITALPRVCPPAPHVSLGEPYWVRGHRAVTLIFRPFRYHADQSQLEVATRIRVAIRFEPVGPAGPADQAGTPGPMGTPGPIGTPGPMGMPGNVSGTTPRDAFTDLGASHRAIPADVAALLARHFVNGTSYLERYPAVYEFGRLVVITTPAFRDAVLPLVTWKRRTGVPADLYLYPLDTGPTPESIKAFLQAEYDSPASLTYILIVGDAEDIPPARGTSGWANGAAADPLYTMLSGYDLYPDAFIGRFSVETAEEAAAVVQKNLWYEGADFAVAGWTHKAAGIASDVAFPPYPEDWILMEGLREWMEAYTYTEFTPIYDPGATSAMVTAALEDGRGWVNYLGHGSPFGWNTSHFGMDDVAGLSNAGATPAIISVACSNGDFEGQTCFAEAWQRRGGVDEPMGAILFQGASVGQTTAAWVAQEEIIRLLVEDAFLTSGGLVFNGSMLAIEQLPGLGNGTGSECVQAWHMFGDPSLFLWTDTPRPLTVEHPSWLSELATEVPVFVGSGSVPVRWARVGAYGEGHLYGSGITGEDGMVTLALDPAPVGLSELEVNVVARNHTPYWGVVPLFPVADVRPDGPVTQAVRIAPQPCSDRLAMTVPVQPGEALSLSIHDLEGRRVFLRRPTPGQDASGVLTWDLRDQAGRSVSPGIYTYRIERACKERLPLSGRFLVIR